MQYLTFKNSIAYILNLVMLQFPKIECFALIQMVGVVLVSKNKRAV